MYTNNTGELSFDSSANKIIINGTVNAKSVLTERDGTIIKYDYARNTNTKWESDNSNSKFQLTFTPISINAYTKYVGIVYFNTDEFMVNADGTFSTIGNGADKMWYKSYVDNTETDFCWYLSTNNPGGGGRSVPRPLIVEKYLSPNTSTPLVIDLNLGIDPAYGTNDIPKIQNDSIRLISYQYIYNSYKTYNTAGTYTDTIPYWCTHIGILLIGGGGTGGTGADGSVSQYSGGGGGGGGAGYTYINYSIPVTSNIQYNINIGNGGQAYINDGSGQSTNLIISGNTYTAQGGKGADWTPITTITGRSGGTGSTNGSSGYNGNTAKPSSGGNGGTGGILQITHTFDPNVVVINNAGNGGNGGKGGDLFLGGSISGSSVGTYGNPGYAAIFFYEK